MAITGTVSVITSADLNSVATNFQSVQTELQADYGNVMDLSLAHITALFNNPLNTIIKYVQTGGTFRGANLFVSQPNHDVESTLTATDKSLVVADRKIVARAMLKAAANRMITLGFSSNKLYGSVKANGNYDILLATFPAFTRTLSSDGLRAMYSATASVVAANL